MKTRLLILLSALSLILLGMTAGLQAQQTEKQIALQPIRPWHRVFA